MAVLQEPIFIIGSPRSGTSILTWCLGQHPNILPLEESNWFAPLALALQSCYEIGTARNERSQLSAMRITREQLLNSIGMAINDLIRCQRNAYEQAFCELDVASPNSAANIFRPSRSSADPNSGGSTGLPNMRWTCLDYDCSFRSANLSIFYATPGRWFALSFIFLRLQALTLSNRSRRPTNTGSGPCSLACRLSGRSDPMLYCALNMTIW